MHSTGTCQHVPPTPLTISATLVATTGRCAFLTSALAFSLAWQPFPLDSSLHYVRAEHYWQTSKKFMILLEACKQLYALPALLGLLEVSKFLADIECHARNNAGFQEIGRLIERLSHAGCMQGHLEAMWHSAEVSKVRHGRWQQACQAGQLGRCRHQRGKHPPHLFLHAWEAIFMSHVSLVPHTGIQEMSASAFCEDLHLTIYQHFISRQASTGIIIVNSQMYLIQINSAL